MREILTILKGGGFEQRRELLEGTRGELLSKELRTDFASQGVPWATVEDASRQQVNGDRGWSRSAELCWLLRTWKKGCGLLSERGREVWI